MKGKKLTETLEREIDRFAEVEHQRWAHWQTYVHSQCQFLEDGSLRIPSEVVSRWQKQIATPYASLSEREKESDREQVRKYFPLLEQVLADTENN